MMMDPNNPMMMQQQQMMFDPNNPMMMHQPQLGPDGLPLPIPLGMPTWGPHPWLDEAGLLRYLPDPLKVSITVMAQTDHGAGITPLSPYHYSRGHTTYTILHGQVATMSVASAFGASAS